MKRYFIELLGSLTTIALGLIVVIAMVLLFPFIFIGAFISCFAHKKFRHKMHGIVVDMWKEYS